MPEGTPPPRLITMQRYGPPPSYPQLKIPGMLLFHLELVLAIILATEPNHSLTNMDDLCMEMSLVNTNKNSPTMRRNQLIRLSIGVIWRKKKKRLKKRIWKLTFSM